MQLKFAIRSRYGIYKNHVCKILRWHWKSSSRMHIGETLTHQITIRNECRLFGGALLWMKFRRDKWIDYLLSDIKTWIRGKKKLGRGRRALCFTTPHPPPPPAPPPPPQKKKEKWICLIYESIIFRSEKPDFRIYPEESHPWLILYNISEELVLLIKVTSVDAGGKVKQQTSRFVIRDYRSKTTDGSQLKILRDFLKPCPT